MHIGVPGGMGAGLHMGTGMHGIGGHMGMGGMGGHMGMGGMGGHMGGAPGHA